MKIYRIQWKNWPNRKLCTVLLLFGFTSMCIMYTLYQKQEQIMEMGVFLGKQVRRLAMHENLQPCDEVPEDLVGAVEVDLKPKPMSEIERLLPWIQRGGHYHPNSCIARQKLAVIIPCRNRYEHLKVLLFHLHPILRSQEIDYTMYVVEQAQHGIFNKGMLMNIGFIEAARREKYDCFVFHDVDLIPENGHTMYRCSQKPLHLAYTSKRNYTIPYPESFGGVILFTTEDYRTTNGFSNCFFGWGGEDDDLSKRVHAAGLGFERIPAENGRFTTIKHGADRGNIRESTAYSQTLVRTAKSRYKRDGLNTIVYYLLDTEQYPLYTRIYVNITRSGIDKRCKALINYEEEKREIQKVTNKAT